MRIVRQMTAICVILALLLISSACDSMTYDNTVKAKSLLSGNIFELDVRNRHNGGDYPHRQGMKFWTSKTMTQFRTELVDQSEQPGTARYFQSAKPSILIHLGSDVRGTSDFCLRLLSADGRESSFILSGLETIVKRSPVESFSLQLPYHLINDARIVPQIVPEINEGAEYEISVFIGRSIEEDLNGFFEFYQQSGWYDLEKGPSSLVIKAISSVLPSGQIAICLCQDRYGSAF